MQILRSIEFPGMIITQPVAPSGSIHRSPATPNLSLPTGPRNVAQGVFEGVMECRDRTESSRLNSCLEEFGFVLENSDDLPLLNLRVPLQEFIDSGPAFQVLKKRIHRYPGP